MLASLLPAATRSFHLRTSAARRLIIPMSSPLSSSSAVTAAAAAAGSGDGAAAATTAAAGGPVEEAITAKLAETFAPLHLQVWNESYMHNVPKGSETHFKVLVVSDAFKGKPPLQRHRAVNQALADELAGPIHALSITAKTGKQWDAGAKAVEPSPNCRGGSKK